MLGCNSQRWPRAGPLILRYYAYSTKNKTINGKLVFTALMATFSEVLALRPLILQIEECVQTSEVLANDQLFARFKKISCGSATGRGNGSEDEICPRLQAACG